jgi:phosphoserine phosphatase RsbU/P
VVEAANGAEEEFGHQRLAELLTMSAGRSVEEMADLVVSAVQDWALTQMDDLTVVVCECR